MMTESQQNASLEANINNLVSELALPVVVTRVLAARGHTDLEEIRTFLTPSLKRDWVDPLLIHGLTAVVDALQEVVNAKLRIIVYGDFDVDGLTATSVMMLGLRELGANVGYFIPNRMDEGYGMTAEALERLFALEPQVVVTVDNGISAVEEIQTLLNRGVRVIVTDHHEPAETLPAGVPICDPKLQQGSELVDIAGVMVALKVICELGKRFGQPDLWRRYIDLATLGTIADMMPLLGENRALVSEGMRLINDSPRPGIAAVHAALSQTSVAYKASNLSFGLIPRLNAAGRLGSPDSALELLLAQDVDKAGQLAQQLNDINTERRRIESLMTAEAFELANALDPDDRIIVLVKDGWHEGVKGIVASRIVNAFAKPAIIFTIEGNVARGSGRTFGNINLHNLVEQAKEFTVRFGGHEGAVGVTVALEDFTKFKAALNQAIAALPLPQEIGEHGDDILINLSDLQLTDVEKLDILEPFGKENELPVFKARNVFIDRAKAVGANKNHLSFTVTDGTDKIAAIWFNCADIEHYLKLQSAVDIHFTLEVDIFRGRKQLKVLIKEVVEPRVCDVCDTYDVNGGSAVDASCARPPEQSMAQSSENLVLALGGAGITLRPAQERALAALAQGRNTLAVMPTGSGKSLIFYIHAARLAQQSGATSIFVYPLRALVSDQQLSIQELFAHIGLRCEVLMGSMDTEQRNDAIAHWQTGQTDILLTTPEYLVNQLFSLPGAREVGFVAIDEAHHIATATSDFRSAYHRLAKLGDVFPRATLLATTATAPQVQAQVIVDALAVQTVVTDASVRTALSLNDQRRAKNRELYLANIVGARTKVLVFVNTRLESIGLVRTLRKLLPAQALQIGYYHGGMPADERENIQAAYIAGELLCLVATSAFGEGVNIPDIRDVVLFNLPFSLLELNQSAGRVGRDGQPSTIHLLYNRTDAKTNEYLLRALAPERRQLIAIYKHLQKAAVKTPDLSWQLKDLADIYARQFGEPANFEDATLTALRIFAELGFLSLEFDGQTVEVRLVDKPAHRDLTTSVRYCEGRSSWQSFDELREQAFSASAEDLLVQMNAALLPGDLTIRPRGGGL